MITIPIWLFGILIATNLFVDLIVFLAIYFIAGVHDLFFVKYHKEESKKECPYFIEGRDDNGRKQ